MTSLPDDGKDDPGLPITHTEMRALLEPLQRHLGRMEGVLQQLSDVSLLKEASAQSSSAAAPLRKVSVSDAAEVGCASAHGAEVQVCLMNGVDLKSSTGSVAPNLAREKSAAEQSRNLPPTPTERYSDKERCFDMAKEDESGENNTIDIADADAPEGLRKGTKSFAISTEESRSSRSMHVDQIEAGVDLVGKQIISKAIEEFKNGSKVESSAMDKLASCTDTCLHRWNNIQEPDYHNRIACLTRSQPFENMCMLVITVNSALVAYVADWQMHNIGKTEPQYLSLLEISFLIYFLIELVLRLLSHRLYFFLNKDMHWNIFDLILVSISLVDFAFSHFAGAHSGSNVGFMRLLRLLKLARILRSLRSFRFFQSLTVLLESFQKSFISLFWGFVLLAFVLYLFSLIFMQALIEYLSMHDDLDPVTRQEIKSNFGSFGTTSVSLYMAVTGGQDWSIYYRIIVATGRYYGIMFVLFTFFFFFALFNILTGAVVEKAMTSSKPDRTELILRQRRLLLEQREELLEICTLMDSSRDGKISWQEFRKWMRNPVLAAYMSAIGLDIDDVELFFATVSKASVGDIREGSRKVTIQHFVDGCLHMKGSATAIDMQRSLYHTHAVHQDLRVLQDSFTSSLRELQHLQASFTSRLQSIETTLSNKFISPDPAVQRLRPPCSL